MAPGLSGGNQGNFRWKNKQRLLSQLILAQSENILEILQYNCWIMTGK